MNTPKETSAESLRRRVAWESRVITAAIALFIVLAVAWMVYDKNTNTSPATGPATQVDCRMYPQFCD